MKTRFIARELFQTESGSKFAGCQRNLVVTSSDFVSCWATGTSTTQQISDAVLALPSAPATNTAAAIPDPSIGFR